MTTFPEWRWSPIAALAILFLPVSLLLAGCSGGLLPEPPKRQLYRVTPAAGFAGSLPVVRAQLLVASPAATAALDTSRIALSKTPLSLDYFADAEWTGRAPAMIQAALVEGFEKSGSFSAVAPEGLGVRGDYVLETELRDFEAVYDSSDQPPRAVVRLNLKLVQVLGLKIIAQTSITRETKAAANTVPDAVSAFNTALGAAVQDAVAWTAGNPALSERRAGR